MTLENPTTAAHPTDFIRAIVAADRKQGKHGGEVVTRFPPEPNGYLHIGHAKSICLNFGLARENPNGRCHLRFDDTNPTTEDMEFVESIQRDVQWLGFSWGDNKFFASDYFEDLYGYAVQLIKQGQAYVCSLSEDDMRAYRGTVTEAGRPSPDRNRSVADNLDLFARMRAGEFADGTLTLRAKIDMSAANMKMRDPPIYRIRHASHYRVGTGWCIYPMYDFAHCLSDAIERITHSICTLEFENNRELYDWFLDQLDVPRHPQQIEFARLNLSFTVMSKRKLAALVHQKIVKGWDDPRMPTIAGLRRRGYTPASIRNFCERIGVAKANSMVDVGQLEFSIRDDLNAIAPRVMAVLRPLKVVIENYPEGLVEQIDAPYFPEDIGKPGSRRVPFAREIYIDRDDFMEHPSKQFHRLAPGASVRLRYAYVIQCVGIEKDPRTGDIVSLRCTYDPSTRSGSMVGDVPVSADSSAARDRKVKGTIHWVSAHHALPVEVRLYDRLFTVEQPDSGKGEDFVQFLNHQSLEVIARAYGEPSLADVKPGEHLQLERLGYFFVDPIDSKMGQAIVLNRTVTLRDSWAKIAAQTELPVQEQEMLVEERDELRVIAAASVAAEPVQRRARISLDTSPQDVVDRFLRYRGEGFALSEEDADLLASEDHLARLFEEGVAAYSRNPSAIANWIVNDVQRYLKTQSQASAMTPAELPITGTAIGRLVGLIEAGTISNKIAKDVWAAMLQGACGGDPEAIIAQQGLQQVSDPHAVLPVIEDVLARHPDNVARYKEGKTNLMGFFVGQVLKATGGKANPQLVNDLIREKLG